MKETLPFVVSCVQHVGEQRHLHTDRPLLSVKLDTPKATLDLAIPAEQARQLRDELANLLRDLETVAR